MPSSHQYLAVAIVLSLTVGIRLVAHSASGGMLRDQADGVAEEGGKAIAIALRLFFFLFGLGGVVLWFIAPRYLPGTLTVPAPWFWLGLTLAQFGLVLLVAVHIALGVQFSGTLHLRADHKLITHGP